MTLKGEPICVVKEKKDKSLVLNFESLRQILQQDDIKNLPVVVISDFVGDISGKLIG